MSLSVIIPTYKNVEFLSELFSSIKNSDFDGKYEVLIGIDSCEDTVNYIYENSFPDNFSFFYFFENGGPYLIKNTLCELSQYDKILFFDSDDIMDPNLLKTIDDQLNFYHVIKPRYEDFKDINQERTYIGKKKTFGEGVFGIKKELFLRLNGFEGWKVAADSDFMGRLYKLNKNILHTKDVLFYRRVHPNSLTIHPETGLSSQFRGIFYLKSKRKGKDDIVNKVFSKSEFQKIDLNNRSSLILDIDLIREKELNEYQEKKIKHESISKIFSNEHVSPVKIKPIKTINYDQINGQSKTFVNSEMSTALKKAKLENIKKNFRR